MTCPPSHKGKGARPGKDEINTFGRTHFQVGELVIWVVALKEGAGKASRVLFFPRVLSKRQISVENVHLSSIRMAAYYKEVFRHRDKFAKKPVSETNTGLREALH